MRRRAIGIAEGVFTTHFLPNDAPLRHSSGSLSVSVGKNGNAGASNRC